MATGKLEDQLRIKINKASRDSQESYRQGASKIHDHIDTIRSAGKAIDGLLRKGAKLSKKQNTVHQNHK